MEKWLVTGGAGFIGSNFILKARKNKWAEVINYDSLTYAANLNNLNSLEEDKGYSFVNADINSANQFSKCLIYFDPTKVIHFAAESHVDRSIEDAETFLTTNFNGTWCLLNECKKHLNRKTTRTKDFAFLHISTDEVYGSLKADEPSFTEGSLYRPNSPYASSKAASDHMVRAFHETYGFPSLVINCSNNYGPHQHTEKLIPTIITRALAGKKIPIYGNGLQIRDWLFVEDHCEAIFKVLTEGKLGETYNVGGGNELTNLSVVNTICEMIGVKDLIEYVEDRPGHDQRYSVNFDKIKNQLGWQPRESFETGLEKTIKYYS